MEGKGTTVRTEYSHILTESQKPSKYENMHLQTCLQVMMMIVLGALLIIVAAMYYNQKHIEHTLTQLETKWANREELKLHF